MDSKAKGSFIGHHERKLDGKGRVMLPAHWRKAIETDSKDIVILSGKNYIALVSASAHFNYASGAKDIVEIAGPLVRYAKLDDNGRIRLSKEDRDTLELSGNKVIIAGYGSHLKIWSPDKWEQEKQRMDIQINSMLGDYNP